MWLYYDRQIFEKNYSRMQRSVQQYIDNCRNRRGTPLIISFLVTNRCMLCCKHCFNHAQQAKSYIQRDDSELTLDQYEKISLSMEPFMKGFFSGGEPFIREDLCEIINLFQKNNKLLWASSSTNGQLTDIVVKQTEKIVHANRYQHFSLAFSLDGYEEYHNEIRGKQTYKRCIETWNICKRILGKYENFDMYICSTINSINQEIMPSFIRWCIEHLQPSMVSILKTRQEPRDGGYLTQVSTDCYEISKKVIEDETGKGNMGDVNHPQTYINTTICDYVFKTMRDQKRSYECFAGQYGGFIDYNGSVGVCEVLPKIGYLSDYECNFLDLWNSGHGRRMRGLAGHESPCDICTHETEGIIPSVYFGSNNIRPLPCEG